jgi:rSAM/selenodomain-associated transferase 2
VSRNPRLSVIIPTLDEARALPALLAGVAAQRDSDHECVVADGGSSDATPALAEAAGARVVVAARGRGRQLNAGAAAARGQWLLFVHADSAFTGNDQIAASLQQLEQLRANDSRGPPAGHYALRFARKQPGHDRLYAFLEAKSASSRPYSINGDQGLLIHRDDFARLGGYDESLPIFEDQDIARRIFAQGRWVLLPGRLVTSARRFEAEGHRNRYLLMALMMAMYHAGLPEFLTDARGLYATQAEAQPLQLAPYRALALRLLRARGWLGGAAATLRCGRLLRDNAWQLALWRDLVRADGHNTALQRYDRYVGPLRKVPGVAATAGAAALLFLLGGLPLIEDRHS